MLSPSFPISNRAGFRLPADGKVHILPVGEYPVRHQGREIVQVVDDKAVSAMLNNLRSDAADPDWGGLCIDFDHQRHNPGKDGRAAGWIDAPEQVERRADGLYASPRWTSCGRLAVEGGDYRAISPEFDPNTLEPLGGNRYRVTRLIGFGITNAPNMVGMKPLSNRTTGDGGRGDGSADAAKHHLVIAGGVMSHVVKTDAEGRAERATRSEMGGALSNRLAGADGAAGAAAREAAHGKMIADLARTLREKDKSLTLHASYAKAQAALDPASGVAGALVLQNRAGELRAADKHLGVAASYRRAKATSDRATL